MLLKVVRPSVIQLGSFATLLIKFQNAFSRETWLSNRQHILLMSDKEDKGARNTAAIRHFSRITSGTSKLKC